MMGKILYYGPNWQDLKRMNLVRACVALHYQEFALDPVFILRVIHVSS
jgi:hypothetical protein